MRLTLLFLLLIGIIGCESTSNQTVISDDERRQQDLVNVLENNILKVWYPKVIDSIHGGFLSDFNYKWELEGKQNKMIVTQARHVWSLSKAYEMYPQEENYLKWAKHGFEFLRNVMLDKEKGGFYQLIEQDGTPIPEADGLITKTAYGNAFALYGIAAYYHASKDQAALELAKKAFSWLEEHSYDPEFPGYFQFLSKDGTPFINGKGQTPPKDQNSSIHLLEAFTELYEVWPDSLVGLRLKTMLTTIRDVIVTEKGYMNLFFNRDWTPVVYRDSSEEVRIANYNLDHVSFGHDVETAFLLLEAERVLENENTPATIDKAKLMVDHALQNGWDHHTGGLFDRGYYFAGQDTISIILDHKQWWAQAEAMNTFLMMSKMFPEDSMNYYDYFEKQWQHNKSYLIDNTFGDWYTYSTDTHPEAKTMAKSGIWKGNYHTLRSLKRCIEMLEE